MGNEIPGVNNIDDITGFAQAFVNDERTYWRCPICKEQVWAYAGYANGGPCLKCGDKEKALAVKIASDVLCGGDVLNTKGKTTDEIADDVYNLKYLEKFQNNAGMKQFAKAFDQIDVDQPNNLEELKEYIPLENEIIEQDIDQKIDESKYISEHVKDHFGLLATSIEVCKFFNNDEMINTDKLLDDIPKKLNVKEANYFCEYLYLYCVDFDYVGKLNRIYGRSVVTHYMHSGLNTFFKNAIENNNKLILWRHGGDEFVVIAIDKENNDKLAKLVHKKRHQTLLPFTSVMFEVSRIAITNRNYINIRDLWDYVACGFYFLGALKKKGQIDRGTSYIRDGVYKKECIDNKWIKTGYKITDTWYTVDDKLNDKFANKLKFYETPKDNVSDIDIDSMRFNWFYWFDMQSLGKLNDKYGLSKADDELANGLLQCVGGKKYKESWKLINVDSGGKFTFGSTLNEPILYKPSNEYVKFVIVKQKNKDGTYGKSKYDSQLIFQLATEKKFKPNNIYNIKYYQNTLNQLLLSSK
eukprot:64050_1